MKTSMEFSHFQSPLLKLQEKIWIEILKFQYIKKKQKILRIFFLEKKEENMLNWPQLVTEQIFLIVL